MEGDKTQTNDELETNQSEHENDSTTEGEGEANESRTYTEAELNERLEAERKERDKRWRERLKKAGGEESEGSQEKDNSQKVGSNEGATASDDVVLARLEARGILDTDIQNYLLQEAQRLQKNPVELLSDSYYTAKIEEKKKEKEQESARPAPSSRTGQTDRSGDLNYHLQRAKDGKGLPSDPTMRRKVVAKLAGR